MREVTQSALAAPQGPDVHFELEIWLNASPADEQMAPRCRQRCRQQNRRLTPGRLGKGWSTIPPGFSPTSDLLESRYQSTSAPGGQQFPSHVGFGREHGSAEPAEGVVAGIPRFGTPVPMRARSGAGSAAPSPVVHA